MSPARKELLKITSIGVLIACVIFALFFIAIPAIAGPFSINTDGFIDVVEHGGRVSLDGLSIVDNTTLGQKTIPVTEEMVKRISDTETAGRKEIVIRYEDKEYVIYFDVKYKVEFLTYGELISSQLVTVADDVVVPDEPKARTGYKFVGWDYDLSDGISASIKINAVFEEIDYPSLDGLCATYGDTLDDVKLSSNEYGHWEFLDSLDTPVGNAGNQTFNVKFVYNGDKTVFKYDYATINVAKQKVEISDICDSFVYDGEAHFPTFTLPEGMNVVTTGVAGVNAGEYKYTVEVIEPNYECFYEGTYKIEKPTVTVSVSSATVTYPASVPEFMYSVEGFDNVELLGIKIDAPSFASTAGVFEIGITYTNENVNYIVQKGIFTVLKGDIEVAKPELGEATFEDALADIEFIGKFLGTWEWEEPDRIIDNMSGITAFAVFTPDNPNYNSVRMEFSITNIKKKVLTFNVIEDTFTYSPGVKNEIVFELTGGNYPEIYKVLTVVGNTPIENAGTYERQLTIADYRYSGTIKCTLTVKKAVPTTDFSKVYEKMWNEDLRLEAIALPGGYTWANPRLRITSAGTESYTAIFTPADTDNYETVTSQFTVKVNKAPVTVVGVLDSYVKDYDTEKYDIKNSGIGAYYTNGKLTVTYLKDGKEVDTIVNAGEYELVVTVEEGKNYLGTVITRKVTVNRVDNNEAVDTDQTVYYLDEMTELELPDGVEGTWSWSVSEIGDAGRKTFVAIFTPDANKNYYPRRVDVTVNVEQLPVNVTFETELSYNGKHQDLGFKNNDIYTVSDVGGTGVGDYTAKLSLVDSKNYTWGFAGADYVINYKIVPSDNEWAHMPADGLSFPYNTSLSALIATAKYGGVKIEYKLASEPDSAYSETVPTHAESYKVRYTTLDTNCKSILVVEHSFTITPIEVIPTPELVALTLKYNTEKQYATLKNTVDGIYEIHDTGATLAGEIGTVTLTITDLDYVWADGSRVLTLTYEIVKADNGWDEAPTITESIIYGEDFTVTGAPIYDELRTYYRVKGSSDEFTLGLPENYGEYEIMFTASGVNAHLPEAQYKVVSIGKATVQGITFTDSSVVYNGNPHSIYISGTLPEGVTVEYENNGHTDANSYTVTAKFTVNDNYYPVDDMTATLTIIKSSITGITFPNGSFVYNGEDTYSIYISGTLPDDVTVRYENNGHKEPGTYTVTAIFTTTGNYESLPDMTATLFVDKATYDMSGITFPDGSFVYNGKDTYSIYISGTLPEGVEVTYSNNGHKIAGTYTVTASFTGDSEHYHPIANKTAKLFVDKATVTGIGFADKTVTYNKNAHSILITGTLPDEVSVSYTNNGQTEFGTYTVTASFTVSDNYYPIADKTATLTINKADITGITFTGTTVIYDGNTHPLAISGTLPSNVTVTYTNNDQKNYGTHTVTATFTVNNANYNALAPMTATLIINKATVTGIGFADKTVTYNKESHSILITGTLPDEVSVSYTNNGQTEFGTYTVTASFTVSDNYYPIDDKTATLTINKADITGITFTGTTVTYDGNTHPLAISGTLPSNVTVTYTNNAQTNHGTHTVTATFTVNNANYNTLAPMTATLTINKATVTFGDITVSDIFYTKSPSPSVVIDEFAKSSVVYLYSTNGQDYAALSTLLNTAGYLNEGDYWVKATIPSTDPNINSASSAAAQFKVDKATPNKITATFSTARKSGDYYYENWLVHDNGSVKVYFDSVLVDVSKLEFLGITFGGDNSLYKFKVTPADADNFNETELSITVKLKTVATIGHGGSNPGVTSFGTIENAIEKANANGSGDVWVIPDASHNLYIRRNVTVNAKVRLILPFGTESNSYNSSDKTSIQDIVVFSRDDDTKCVTRVYVDSNVQLTVKGTMIVSGEVSSSNIYQAYIGQTSGNYAKIILMGGSSIYAEGTSSSEAVIKCYGFIQDYSSSVSGSVTMEQYSSLYQPFMIRDYRNGGYLSSILDKSDVAKFSPFLRFQMINVESLTIYEYGSRMYAAVNINSSLGVLDSLPLIISSDMSGRGTGVLTMTEEYSSIRSKYNRATDVTSLDLYGGAQTAALVIDKIGFKVSTDKGVFPISYHYSVTLNRAEGQTTDAEFVMGQNFKLLPGGSITVNSGAFLNITGSLSIYETFDENTIRHYQGAPRATHKYPTDKAPGMLIVYGRLEANYLGGNVYTDRAGATIKINGGTTVATHEVLEFLDDTWSSEIKTYKTVVTSLKLHYITGRDANGNITSTNKVGYVEVGNTYTSNADSKTWVPATTVVMPQYIVITVPTGCWIETSEAILSIDYDNNEVEFKAFNSLTDGNTVHVLPGAIVTYHMYKNYLFIESGATETYSATVADLHADAYEVNWVANNTIPAVYYVPAVTLDGTASIDSCTITFKGLNTSNNADSSTAYIEIVATKEASSIRGNVSASITVSGLTGSSTSSGTITEGTPTSSSTAPNGTWKAEDSGWFSSAAVTVTVTIRQSEGSISITGA